MSNGTSTNPADLSRILGLSETRSTTISLKTIRSDGDRGRLLTRGQRAFDARGHEDTRVTTLREPQGRPERNV
jgi:hypothetical protein